VIAVRRQLTLVIILACACGTPRRIEVETLPGRATLEHSSLRLSVHPVFEPTESRRLFGADLPGSGIVPIFIRADNGGPVTWSLEVSRSMLVRVEGDSGAGGVGEAGRPIDSHDRTVTGMMVVGAVAPATLVVTLPLSALLSNRAEVVRRRIFDAELGDCTLPSGGSAQGFVYARIADEQRTSFRQASRFRIIARPPPPHPDAVLELRAPPGGW